MSVSAYVELQTLISSNQLQLVNVIAPPRACGTAVHQALTQANEAFGQLNEPTVYANDLQGRKWDYVANAQSATRTFEDVCGHILKRYRLFSEAQRKEKVTLVVHDLTQCITLPEYRKIVGMSSHVILTIRNTSQQALSMLTRYVNDKISEPAGSKIKTQEVLDLMKSPESFQKFAGENPGRVSHKLLTALIKKNEQDAKMSIADYALARKSTLDIFAKEFNICWENIYCFFQTNKKEFPTHPHTVFDAQSLFTTPKEALKALSKQIKVLNYNDNMVDKWTKGCGADFFCVITEGWGSLAQTNAWNGPARNSTGITVQKDSVEKSLEITGFPVEVQELITKCDALYRKMLVDAIKTAEVGMKMSSAKA